MFTLPYLRTAPISLIITGHNCGIQ